MVEVRACCVSLLLFGASAGIAQETRAGTPAGESGTPKAALLALHIGLRDGDREAVRNVVLAKNAQEADSISAMADFAALLVELHRAAADTFGDEGAKVITGDTATASTEALAAIEKADIKIDGDEAMVTYAGAGSAPLRLWKVDGRWRLPFAALQPNTDPAALGEHLNQLTRLSADAKELIAEMRAGRFKNPEKAAQAWREQMMSAVAPRAATGPFTRPAKP